MFVGVGSNVLIPSPKLKNLNCSIWEERLIRTQNTRYSYSHSKDKGGYRCHEGGGAILYDQVIKNKLMIKNIIRYAIFLRRG